MASSGAQRSGYTVSSSTYYKLHSYNAVQNKFSQDFNEPKAPSKSIIYGWIKKFEQEGTVKNLNSKLDGRLSHSGRKKIRTDEVIEAVRQSVLHSPKRSTRKRCQLVGLSRTTLLRVLHDDLRLYAYHIQIHQKLANADKVKRFEMAKWLLAKIDTSKTFLDHLWTTDEAHFHLDGQVNSRNNVYWGSERPAEVTEKPLHSQKVTVWAALSMKGVVGPLFFEEQEKTVTINTDRYLKILEVFWKELEENYKGYLPRFCSNRMEQPPYLQQKPGLDQEPLRKSSDQSQVWP